MNRVDFTRKISWLLVQMGMEGERPIEDYCKRSDDEQKRLFDAGKSKCDGKNKISQHQRGRALDIYFVLDDGKNIGPPKKGHAYWHRQWERMGGKPAIEWDQAHYEG